MMVTPAVGGPSRSELLNLYRRLLRACENYPSKNKMKIYGSIREEFRLHKDLDPKSEKTAKEISVALKGLQQLHQFDNRMGSSNFSVQLEQNPFPKPDNYKDKRTERVEQVLEAEGEEEKAGGGGNIGT